MRHLIYLHGFRSSPASTKARQVRQWLERAPDGADIAFICPQLPVSPHEAAATIRAVLAETEDRRSRLPLAVVGSSLGGYYATWLGEQVESRVVLLNPAVRPERDLAAHLGTQKVWHGDDTIDVRPEFLDELRELDVGPITRPERYFLVAATGDELLDWREMVARYPGARQRVIDGGDHALSDFADHIDDALRFALGRT